MRKIIFLIISLIVSVTVSAQKHRYRGSDNNIKTEPANNIIIPVSKVSYFWFGPWKKPYIKSGVKIIKIKHSKSGPDMTVKYYEAFCYKIKSFRKRH
ncbi:MAG: hypothetical protein MUF50_04880 [Planctomycetes bacterium]|jgi:hypothetical protein|nr:hypothetical protein [Planctomycetota bacterium]